ncbi:hypothetical protein BV898_19690 [Hypsibius exemplaris]|uniref:Uncharacterized protein n=1 Tax=Hypsibius exemplaris TaxID=2072580 RepID=A0A9X6NK46_HYPEX|nr:hypothetical protein BV898_19690 [Hypsibius exemplaris]
MLGHPATRRISGRYYHGVTLNYMVFYTFAPPAFFYRYYPMVTEWWTKFLTKNIPRPLVRTEPLFATSLGLTSDPSSIPLDHNTDGILRRAAGSSSDIATVPKVVDSRTGDPAAGNHQFELPNGVHPPPDDPPSAHRKYP